MSRFEYRFLADEDVWTCRGQSLEAASILVVCITGTCRITDLGYFGELTECTACSKLPSPTLSVELDGRALVIAVPDGLDFNYLADAVLEVSPLEAAILMDVFIDNYRTEEHRHYAVGLFCHQLAGSLQFTEETQQDEKELVQSTLDYFLHNLDASITLSDLVTRCDCSKSHICKEFQNRIGASPMLALARMRVKRAKELLAGTDMTIAQVGGAVGYSTVSSFSHFFKKHTDLSPRDYRENVHWLV